MFLAVFFVVPVFCGCNVSDAPPSSASVTPNEPVLETMEFADQWDEVLIHSGYAITTVTSTGHFIITRNACAIEENGAVTMEQWNSLAQMINGLREMTPPAEPTCFPALEASRALDGRVEVKYKAGLRTVLEVRGREFCVYAQDVQLGRRLGETINSVLATAFSEGCTIN
jgi:hypothetical protein